MHSLYFDTPNMERIAVFQQLIIVIGAVLFFLLNPLIFPVLVSFVRKVQLHTKTLCKLTSTRKKVRMNMCFRYSHDVESFFFGKLNILINIALRVDNDGFLCFLAANQIGILCEFRVKYLAE